MKDPAVKQKFRRWLKWAGWVALAQFLILNISAALYAYKFTHIYEAAVTNSKPRQPNFLTKTWRLFSGPLQTRSPQGLQPVFTYDTVVLKTKNGISIDAWYATPDSAAKGTVIIFHGLLSNKGMLMPEAAEFRYLGYNILMVDFRAHGNSSGSITTMGIKEADEVKMAYDFIRSKNEGNIFIYGTSMGAVAVSRAVAQYHLQPTGLILEMPFASLQSHIRARARVQGYTGFFIKPFSFLVTFWIGAERGLKSFKHQTAGYTKQIHCPVLVQWGTNDAYVLKEETEKVFNSLASHNKKLVVYEKAGHESLLQFDTPKWRSETEYFLRENNH
jgi:hypothetical protein